MTKPAIWFPTIKANTGVDRFTIDLVKCLKLKGIQAEIAWLPLRAEYAPWSIEIPEPPKWANIIHINSWLHKRFYKKFNLPIIVTSHGCVHDNNLLPYKTFFQKIYHQFWIKYNEINAFKYADKITAVSQYTAQQNSIFFNLNDIMVVPNAIQDSFLKKPEKREPHAKFKLLFIGRLSQRKGADILKKIMLNTDQNIHLFFTQHPEDNNFSLNELPNTTNVGWITNKKDLKNLIDQSDALIFPSRMEGMSLAVLESMARGLPIICNNSSSLPEIIQHYHNGFICSNNDISTYIDSIFLMSSSQELWQKMRINSYQTVFKSYKLSSTVNNYVKIYETTLKSS